MASIEAILDVNDEMVNVINQLLRLRRPDLYGSLYGPSFEDCEANVQRLVRNYMAIRYDVESYSSEASKQMEANFRFITNLCDGNFVPDEYLIDLWNEGRTSNMRSFYAKQVSRSEFRKIL